MTGRRSIRGGSWPAPGSGSAPRVSTRTGGTRPGPMDADAGRAAPHASPLQLVLPELRAALTAVAEDARHVMVVTDADGVLLWREGSTRVRHRADALGFTEGARWTEGAVGTNAIGTALAEDAPVQIFSAEHFVRTHHGWTCTACPGARPAQRRAARRRRRQRARRDGPPHDGRARRHGGEARGGEPVAPARAPARRAARRSGRRCWPSGADRASSSTTTAGSPPSAGCRTWNGSWRRAADGPVAVHGLGLCVPEPVPGGWLLRPAVGGPERRCA